MTTMIAESLFWGVIASFILLVYNIAVLPGVRQGLRFEVFQLRDALRSLVVNGQLSEDDERFALLQENLNFIASNLHRFDLLGAYQAIKLVKEIDEEGRKKITWYLNLMKEAPPPVKSIYEKSVIVFVKAVVFNSLLSFALVTVGILVVTAVRVPFSRLKSVLWNKAKEDSQYAFFNASRSAV